MRWSIVDFWLRDLCRVGWAELVNRMYIHSINLLLWFLNLVIKLECSKSGLVTLTRLGNKDLTKSSEYVFQYVETWKHQWFRRGTYWWEDWSRLIVMRELCYWSIELRDRQWTEYLMVTVTVLRLCVKETCYYYILVQMDEIVYWSVFRLDIVILHVTEITRKILSDRNTCIVLLFYHLHGDIILIIIVNIINIVTIILSFE